MDRNPDPLAVLAPARESGLEFPPTLVDMLRDRARRTPENRAYTFLAFNGVEAIESHVTYEELDRRARCIAVLLGGLGRERDRVLVVCPPGLDYLSALFGALYAGFVAVPAYPPFQERAARRLESITRDSGARVALTTSGVIEGCAEILQSLPSLRATRWMDATQQMIGLEHMWKEPTVSSESLAYLQYTSGSTGTPRGVMLTHSNALADLELVRRHFAIRDSDRHLSWAPPYHDLGLIAGLLLPIYMGKAAGVGMSPLDFLANPSRWLRELTRQGANVSGGPNFAYELCVRKIPEEDRRDLNLEHWEYAHCGGEPIRAETIDRFYEAFGPYGFQREAFSPCYGSAETTLVMSGSERLVTAPVLSLDREEYGRGRVVETAEDVGIARVVSNGPVFDGHEVLIVDPVHRTLCADDEIGEIWIAGPVVTNGYWERARETTETCQAHLADSAEAELHPGPYLRSGDLGFLNGGHLYICGRLDDLIIIRGINHHPQDIETTVGESHPALRPGCCAAFSVELDARERLVLVQELRRGPQDVDDVVRAIRTAVKLRHELTVQEIVLIEQSSLPKTTSGKVSRRPCRSAFLDQKLAVVGRWSLPQAEKA